MVSFDDTRVQKLSVPNFNESKAYILFYVKKDWIVIYSNSSIDFLSNNIIFLTNIYCYE